ncbi:MAG: ABC transporter substrate-binding protein, partial [Alphaproteobacteria bacterium]
MHFSRIARLKGLALAGVAAASLGLASAPFAANAADVIKIGAPLALTGGLADEGKKQKIAYEMWLERVNAAGGIKVGDKMMPVELVVYDYQTDGKRAAQLTEKLITDDKVNFITAPFGSGHTKIAAGVAERYGIPIMASVASSESVYDQGYENLFGTLAPNSGLTGNMMKLFKESFPDVKTVAVLGREDVFPNAMAKALVDGAPAA